MRRDLLRVDREFVLLGNRLHNCVACYVASGVQCAYIDLEWLIHSEGHHCLDSQRPATVTLTSCLS